MKKLWKWITAGLLLLALTGALALADQIGQTQDELTEAQRLQKEAEARAARYASEKASLETDLAALEQTLASLEADLAVREDGLEDLRLDLEDLRLEEELAEERLADQKADMMLRIRYMYEQDSGSWFDLIAGARSLSEVLNSMDHISSITGYDRQKMAEYRAENERLTSLREQAEAKEEAMSRKIAEVRDSWSGVKAEAQALLVRIAEVRSLAEAAGEDAQAFAAQVAEKEQLLARLKAEAEAEAARRRAEEEARKAAEAEAARRAAEEAARRAAEEAAERARREAAEAAERARREAEEAAERARREAEAAAAAAMGASDRRAVGSVEIDGSWLNPSGYTNLELLAAIIYCEGAGQPYEGKIAIANVIFNRILSPKYQTTIYDVVYGKGQFTPVGSGRLAVVLADHSYTKACIDAAQDALNGARVISTDYLYFRRNRGEIDKSRWKGWIVIGDHIFHY